MAADLGGAPHSGLTVQLCGDAHLSNFGLFASPERRLVFDLNDFDETHPGPFEWDVKRLAASFELAGRDNGLARPDGASRPPGWAATTAADAPVRRGLRPQVWYAHLEMSTARLEQIRPAAEQTRPGQGAGKLIAEGPRPRQPAGVRKLIRVDGTPTGSADPPLLVPMADLAPDRTRRAPSGMTEC